MMKRAVMFGILTLATLVSARQDGMPPLPKELNALNDMVGTWTGEMAMSWGPTPQKAKTVMVSNFVMGGRFLESKTTIELPGMGPIEGRQLITYNEKEKVYVSWWFDSMAGDAMVQKGKFEGKKLILDSEPMAMDGMEGKQVFRSVYTTEGTKATFIMEAKGADGKWVKMMEGTHSKKK